VVDLSGVPNAATEYKVFDYGTIDAANDSGDPAKLAGVTIANSDGGYNIAGAGLYVNSVDKYVYLTGLSIIEVIDVTVLDGVTDAVETLQAGQRFGDVVIGDSGTLTVDSSLTAIPVTNLTMDAGSVIKSTQAPVEAVTVTVSGNLANDGVGIGYLGDYGDHDADSETPDTFKDTDEATNLTLADGSTYDWTFGSDTYIDANGEITFETGAEGGVTIQLHEGVGSPDGSDVKVFLSRDGIYTGIDENVTILKPAGTEWTWNTVTPLAIVLEGEGDDEQEYLVLQGLVAGDVDVPGDANGDDVVDATDYDILNAQIGGAWNGVVDEDPDFNDDDVVDLVDFAMLRAAWPAAAGAPLAVVTPEPATMSLLAIGGLALLRRRRRK